MNFGKVCEVVLHRHLLITVREVQLSHCFISPYLLKIMETPVKMDHIPFFAHTTSIEPLFDFGQSLGCWAEIG